MKRKLYVVLIQLFFGGISFAQEPVEVSPNGIFDKVFTSYGDELKLADIAIGDPFNSPGAPENAVLIPCNSGYFDLYYEIGSGMEGSFATEALRRAVLCQVFSDISQFIVMPPTTSPSAKVNILVKNINPFLQGYSATNPAPAATSGALGFASGYYVLPTGAPSISGIADNEIWKTITAGVDSYTNVTSPLTSSANSGTGIGFYHGYVALNFDNPNINWHLNLSQTTPVALYDMYSIVLHEVTHALGFVSEIDAAGNSKFGPSYNYYTRYDRELQTQANQNLVTNSGSCSMYNYSFNPALSANVMSPSAAGCASLVEYGGSVNELVFTPSTFAPSSSLHHFEDICRIPPEPDNEYYVMSDQNPAGPNYMKRYLKPDERNVLCDIGYTVNSTYGSAANLTNYNYGGSQCSGIGVAGINDGLAAGGGYQFTGGMTGPLTQITGILSNDVGLNLSFECLEVIIGGGTVNVTSGTATTIIQYTPTSPGLKLLRYVPVSGTNRGNITYIYVYITDPACQPSACTIVNNSDFENILNCNSSINPIQVSCWRTFANSPDIFSRFCTGSWWSVPTPISQPPSDSWSLAPNNTFQGLMSHGDTPLTTAHYLEGVQSILNFPLVNTNSYTISFRAKLANNYNFYPLSIGAAPSANLTGEILFAGSNSILAPVAAVYTSLPANLTQLGLPSTVPNDDAWHFFTHTFTHTGPNINNLIVLNSSNMNTLVGEPNTYIYIDDIEIVEVSPATTLTLPNILCINQTIPDMSIYAPVPGGVFSGPGVNGGGVYSFDATSAGVGTHAITYVYTNAIGCVVTIHQQIQVVATTLTASASAAPASVCVGQPVNLTANSPGATSYLWTPGNLNGSTVNPIVNAPTLFTLTATNAAGCVATDQVSVGTLQSPIVTVTPTLSTTCAGQAVQLSASGGNSYLWTPAQTLSSPTAPIVDATPTSNTTYTVTGTDASGCTGTAQATVNMAPCPDCLTGTTISGTLVANSPQPSTMIRIPNDITIAGNITFDRNTVKVLPGVTITVAPGATLNIIGAHLYGCQDMWQGIVVQDGGTVNVLPYTSAGFVVQTSLIEDAMIALDYEPISSQQTAARMQIDDVTFNRNETAVRIQGYPFSNANTVFSYKNSLVTCRDIFDPAFPLSWHKTSVIKVVNGNPNPFLEPYITTSVYPLVNLKAPLSNTISQNGLWLVNVGSTSASAPYTYHSLIIGSPITMEYNVFDHVIKGISATNTNLKVINSTFQFPKAITWALSWPSAFISGVHAYKQGSGNYKVDIAGTLAQPNRFYGLETALRVNNYRSIQFEKNVIRSNRQITTPSTGYSNGEYGVRMYLKKYDFVNISDNYIHNINKGVYLNANFSGNAPSVFVENNTFDCQLGSNIGGFAEDAILLESLQPNNYGYLWVNNNDISGVYRGITLNSWIKVVTRVSGNTINLAGLNTFTAPSHGIALTNCTQSQGVAAEISYNNIYGFTKNTANFKGIAFTSSPGYMLNCNAVKTTYSGLYFNGNCNPTQTYNNIMEDHRYGFVLDNGGVIGQQGDQNFPADNRWLGNNWSQSGSGNGQYKNACLNLSNTLFSSMYVRQASAYDPSGSVLILAGNFPYTFGVSINPNPVSNPPFFIPCHEENNPGVSALTTSELVEAMEENVDSTSFTTEVARVQTYRALDADTTLMDSSAVLTTFYGDYENSNAGALMDVEEAAGQDNNSLAQTTMSSVIPDNTVEASYKLYYEALLHFQDSLFDATDSLTLIGLAYGCPTLQGSAVIQAASLYNTVYEKAEVFENICPVYLDKSPQQLNESSEASPHNSTFSLYPIPNKGSFYLKGTIGSNFSVTLLNTTGSIVHQMKINEDTNEQHIQTHLSSGTYILVLKDVYGKEVYRERIILID